ncbi:MAG: hypothetical protein Ct9H300mP7_5330 [Verrucomicrobiota bacterium]|nr:MAG: hypothetical protein Ct9H300mP7_5330 [Verrucomicrobiota bacterium]
MRNSLAATGSTPAGALQGYQRPGDASPTVNTGLYRKLLRKDEPYTDLIDFTANINIANPHRFTYVADEVNLPNYINLMAAMAVPSNHDQLTKNYYLYRDPTGRSGSACRGMVTRPCITGRMRTGPARLRRREAHPGTPTTRPTRSGRTTCTVPFSTTRSPARCICAGSDAGRPLPRDPERTSLAPIVSGEVGATSAFYHVPKTTPLTDGFQPGLRPGGGGWAGRLWLGYENSASDYADLISTRIKPSEIARNARSIYTRMNFNVDTPAQSPT